MSLVTHMTKAFEMRTTFCCLLLLILSTGLPGTYSESLPDGSTCYLDKDRNQIPPFCAAGKFKCVVNQVPNEKESRYVGTCDSNFFSGSYCAFMSIPYAVGTKNITAKSTCVRCDCNLHPELRIKNKARCDCSPLPPCYVDNHGNPVGAPCPNPESMCVITRPGGGGMSENDAPVDMGECRFPEYSQRKYTPCGTAGPTWNQKWYATNVSGVPFPGNRCVRCVCAKFGRFKKCSTIRGCKP